MSKVLQSPPKPPDNLSFGQVTLHFMEIVPGVPQRGFVPYYHFRISTANESDVGHINMRFGDTEHVRNFAGHIGYEIREPFRGHSYALQACCALAPFVRSIYSSVIITADPDNQPSIRTIERLGAHFIDEVPVPPYDPHYNRGSRTKRRYQWLP
ncbi:MAG TPA: GNAT family N-acetyltransferase [Verrucomicrobiae bacterium]|nr:GNAT family N-acetyltransferase [Verrucomicrobiae bacterium]